MNTVKATAVYLLAVGLITGWIYWAVTAGEQDGLYGELVWISPLLILAVAGVVHLIVILPIAWLAERFGGNK